MPCSMKLMIRRLIALLGLFCVVSAYGAETDQSHRTVLGYVEAIVLEPVGLPLKARLDTGAQLSSLHSVETATFERDGKEWVRFHVPVGKHRLTKGADDDQQLQVLVLERPVKRTVLIKRKGAASQRRYVVELSFCLDGQEHETEFSLTDRSGFLYPALLGRKVLKGVALVDPAHDFLAKETCASTPLQELSGHLLDVAAEDEGDEDEDDEE